MSEEIRIYVACLAAYNNGMLHGEWMNATQDLGDLQEQVQIMLASSPVDDAEEWAIHEYEGFGSYRLSEYECIQNAHEVACFIEEHGGVAAELLNYFCSIDEAKTAMEEHYSGCHKSVADFAEALTCETSEVPERLAFYIDYEKMGRDMELSGDIFSIATSHDEVHVFWSH